jgi:hypothetical protein
MLGLRLWDGGPSGSAWATVEGVGAGRECLGCGCGMV